MLCYSLVVVVFVGAGKGAKLNCCVSMLCTVLPVCAVGAVCAVCAVGRHSVFSLMVREFVSPLQPFEKIMPAYIIDKLYHRYASYIPAVLSTPPLKKSKASSLNKENGNR